MQGITFSRINIKSFNIVLSIILPIVLMAFLSDNAASLAKFDVKWLLSAEFVKMTAILLCYTMPLTYFMGKLYEMVSTPTSTATSVFAFVAVCILALPLAFTGLVTFARVSFAIPIALTIAVFYVYFRSTKPVAQVV